MPSNRQGARKTELREIHFVIHPSSAESSVKAPNRGQGTQKHFSTYFLKEKMTKACSFFLETLWKVDNPKMSLSHSSFYSPKLYV